MKMPKDPKTPKNMRDYTWVEPDYFNYRLIQLLNGNYGLQRNSKARAPSTTIVGDEDYMLNRNARDLSTLDRERIKGVNPEHQERVFWELLFGNRNKKYGNSDYYYVVPPNRK